MGLLDILKKLDKIQQAVEPFLSNVDSKVNSSAGSNTHYNRRSTVSTPSYVSEENAYCFNGTVEQYFSKLLAERFPEYSVRRNLSVRSENGETAPISFLLVRNERPCLAIILCHSQQYKRKRYLNTIQACERRGIPAQRYFTDFRNDANYVTTRIRNGIR